MLILSCFPLLRSVRRGMWGSFERRGNKGQGFLQDEIDSGSCEDCASFRMRSLCVRTTAVQRPVSGSSISSSGASALSVVVRRSSAATIASKLMNVD